MMTRVAWIFWLLPLFFVVASEGQEPEQRQLCRTRGLFLESDEFMAETCALCYIYIPSHKFKVPQAKWNMTGRSAQNRFIGTQLTNGTLQIVANASDAQSPLLETFADSLAAKHWKDCCKAAQDCCHLMSTNQTTSTEGHCPPTWDGWQCWTEGGDPGEINYERCPPYIYFHSNGQIVDATSCGSYAEKQCMPNGRWYFSNLTGEWTNYATCSSVKAHLTQEWVHMVFYIISIVALTPAIIIFFAYKVLRVPRILIHKNLFASLLLHCVALITFKATIFLPYITNGNPVNSTLHQNTFVCKLLVMLIKYSRLTNYTWMFCEGYYLHRLLANTFEEERSIGFILSIGWGVPMVPCIVYSVWRSIIDDKMCWALPATDAFLAEWVYMMTGLACIIANAIFFVNIFRILITKLRAPHANEPAHFRKAVKAIVILLPLFGLHWLLTLFRPQNGDCIWIFTYKYLTVSMDGLQGLVVAIACCYQNEETRNLLSQSWAQIRHRFLPLTGNQEEAGAAPNSAAAQQANNYPMSEINSVARHNSETFVTNVTKDSP